MSSELRFAVLGPVRAWRGDAELDLGAPQQRAVLAALLLAEGRQVSLSALIDALWEDDPPRASVGTVRTYVSRLRRCLGDGPAGGVHDVIESAGDGYVLPLRSAALDLDLFLRQARDAHTVRDADPEQAAALLRDALGLWRGVPLSGLPGRYADSQRIRLAELRMAAVEERLALDIELGRHVAAAAELKSLLREAPLRERLTELLMLALYKSGRQAEALAVFDGARRLLDDELGIVPGPAIRDMHQRILRMDEDLIRMPPQPPAPRLPLAQSAGGADPSLAIPLVRPAQLPADLPTFAGRDAELAELDSLLDGAGPSRAVVIGAIDGMAGIGKTALAIHWAHKVAAQFQDGQLYVNLRAFDPSGATMAPGEALHGFLDALGVAPNRIPDGLDAQAALYRSLMNNRRILIVLDNARNVGQVRPLLPGSPGCVVLITSRNQLTGLITTHGARSLTVDAFSADEARDALNRRMGPTRLTADPDALAEVIDLCAGLPLAMAIVAARAITRPHLPMNMIASELRDTRTRLDALSADEGAADVRAVFSWSYRLLSERAGRLFRLLSVHSGPDFSLGAAAGVAGLPPAETVPLLLELTAARLITEHQPGRFSSHDLIRVYATELSTTLDAEDERHAALGRLLDFYLHTAYAAHRLLRPHFVPPAPAPARPGVTPDELRDYRQAMAWFTAERHVLRAAARNIAYADRHADLRPYTWQLALTIQQFYQRQGYCYEWAGMMHTALGAALSAGDLAAQAHARRGLAGAYHFLGRNDEALAELERTRQLFTELGYEGEHAYVHSNFGTVLASQGHYDEAVGHYWQAYDLYEGLQHVKGQAAALEGIGWCHGQQGRHYLAIRYVENAMILYRRLDDRKGQSDCWARLGDSRHLLGQYRQAMDCHLRAIALGQEIGSRASEAEVLTRLGDSAHAAGDPIAARQAWDNALIILDELRLPQASSVRERMGRLGRAVPGRGEEPGNAPGKPLADCAVN